MGFIMVTVIPSSDGKLAAVCSPAPGEGAGGAGSMEDADATRSDQKADDDQHDPPEDLAAEQGENAGHHQDHRENPEQQIHVTSFQIWYPLHAPGRAKSNPGPGPG